MIQRVNLLKLSQVKASRRKIVKRRTISGWRQGHRVCVILECGHEHPLPASGAPRHAMQGYLCRINEVE
jgi:hypothetical protein